MNNTVSYSSKIILKILILLINSCSLAIAEEYFKPSEDIEFSFGANVRGSLKSFGNSPFLLDSNSVTFGESTQQNLKNQASSAAAYSHNLISTRFGLKLKEYGQLFIRLDYNSSYAAQYNLYPYENKAKQVQIRNMYVTIPFEQNGYSLWLGKRTIEFDEYRMFQAQNPFNQIDLLGLGIETPIYQAALAITKSNVNTTSININQETLMNANGLPSLTSKQEYIATAFISGKFLLAEAKLFEPIFAIRIYTGAKGSTNSLGTSEQRIKIASSSIVGGIFTRPLTDGMKGQTTFWFASYPITKSAIPYHSLQTAGIYPGSARIPIDYPANVIGISDSSEINFNKSYGISSEIIVLNNTYPSPIAVLTPSSNKLLLVEEKDHFSRLSTRVSIDIQPFFSFSKELQLGIDLNYNFVQPKFFDNDANAFIITPLLKYSIERNSSNEKYLYTSISYGFYDWKLKKLSDSSQTDRMFTSQTGLNMSF